MSPPQRRAHGLSVHEAGPDDAPVVVLVHGSMDRSAGMLRLSRHLGDALGGDRLRIVRYDRRGYGRSAPHPGPFGMAGQVDDLVAVLAGRTAVVVGHSYGGNVALAAAAHHPELVAAAAVYETPMSWAPWWPGGTAGSRAVAHPGPPEDAAEMFMRRMIGEGRWEALPDRVRAARRGEGVAMVGELADLRVHPPWNPAQLAVPVLFAFGSDGAPHHRRAMTEAAAMVPESRLVELPDCGHDAVHRDAGLFAERVVLPVLAAAGRPWSERPEGAG